MSTPRVSPRHCEHLCPKFQAAMDVLSRPWNGLIMAILAQEGALRFSELRELLSAMGDRMLSARLKELEARGLVAREVAAGPPVRVSYALTELGRGFSEVYRAMGRWGERLAAAASKSTLRSKSSKKNGDTKRAARNR
ncbi:MAG TPA: helix-turn-helix domain-containing protein [Stellaceae bacterium]|nr:helix-turn-helix domain-containing protein [Stellaceae bacterium]